MATNLALYKVASQSTTYIQPDNAYSWDASKAVDDDINTGIHTIRRTGNWWIVDLGTLCTITSVIIYNRRDCCQDRLDGAILSILDTNKIDTIVERTIEIIEEDDGMILEFDFG